MLLTLCLPARLPSFMGCCRRCSYILLLFVRFEKPKPVTRIEAYDEYALVDQYRDESASKRSLFLFLGVKERISRLACCVRRRACFLCFCLVLLRVEDNLCLKDCGIALCAFHPFKKKNFWIAIQYYTIHSTNNRHHRISFNEIASLICIRTSIQQIEPFGSVQFLLRRHFSWTKPN